MAKAAKKKGAFIVAPQPDIDIKPLNQTQSEYMQAMREDTIIFALGSAGTGKTFCACGHAAKAILKDNRQKVVLGRAVVGLGKGVGFLPGNIEEKYEPWLAPMIGELRQILTNGIFDCKRRNGQIEYQLIEMLRGRSYDDTIILIDEAQNLSLDELKALTTRIGRNTQLILMGDTSQYDIKDIQSQSPIAQFAEMLLKNNVRDTSIIEFNQDDIVRSDIVKDLVIAFQKEGI